MELLAENGGFYGIQVFQYACIIAVSALGLNVIIGYTGLFSLGHAAFYGVGAYTAALLMKTFAGAFGDAGFIVSQAAFLGSLLAGGAAAALLAWIVGLPVLRLTSDYLGVATLALGEIMKVLFDNSDAFIPELGGVLGMTGIPRMTSPTWVALALAAAVLVVRNIVRSTYGRVFLAVREDEVAAGAMGIDTYRYKVTGFTLGCAFAGVAGGLYAHMYGYIYPTSFDFYKSFDLLMIVVLGGLGSMAGTLVAAFGWIFLLEGMRAVLSPELLEYRWVLIPLLLVMTMILRPQGFFGVRKFPFLRGRG